jgi:signal transduction histidine kinase
MKILGALTSGVAHEVRNPLNAIWAITEALFQDIKNDTHLNIYKDHIKSQVERLTLLMQELLDFGKPFSFKDADQLPLPELCKNTIEMWKQSQNNKNHVEFVNKAINENGIVKGDPTKLQQVLVNLLDNASQHSPKESIIIVNLCRKMSKYQIEIIDQGAGISKESLSRVFDPFFTTRPKGTGLGLSIVKHIISAHEGTIELYNNNPPPGATATVTLPMVLSTKSHSPSEHISKESITA